MVVISENLIDEIIVKIEEKAYVPNSWVGVSDMKEVYLKDVIEILDGYRPEKKRVWW